MGNLDSSIRSAARATYSAYKRQPIRWRLAGGSAALTLVILCGFAVIVGTLTTRAIYAGLQPRDGGHRRPAGVAAQLHVHGLRQQVAAHPQYKCVHCPELDRRRLGLQRGDPRGHARTASSCDAFPRRAELRRVRRSARRTSTAGAWRRARWTPTPGWGPPVQFVVQYARRVSTVRGDRQPREAVPGARRAGRRRARAAGRAGHGPPGHGADRRADRRRARRRAHARSLRPDPPPRGRRRGGRAGRHAGLDAPRAG